MASFSVHIHRIADGAVSDHPKADRLSLVRIGGYTTIAAKNADGSHRYAPGDLVLYVPEGAIVPEYLLRRGFWDEKNDKGLLAGPRGDRVKAIKLRQIFSQGILFPVEDAGLSGGYLRDAKGSRGYFSVGENAAAFLGISKYSPPVPEEMKGAVTALSGVVKSFDVEPLQALPDLFEPGERVIASEKLHGTMCQIGIAPGLGHRLLFGEGDVYVTSKGLGNDGLGFIDIERRWQTHLARRIRTLPFGATILKWFGIRKETTSVYVAVLRELLQAGLAERLRRVARANGDVPVRLFGEIFGRGIQDLNYGTTSREFRVFDAMIGDRWLAPAEVTRLASDLGLTTVPVLYEGAFDLPTLESHRDGKDTISGSHVREGIVIRAASGAEHPVHGRKTAKFVSPDYLLRKGGTEYS